MCILNFDECIILQFHLEAIRLYLTAEIYPFFICVKADVSVGRLECSSK